MGKTLLAILALYATTGLTVQTYRRVRAQRTGDFTSLTMGIGTVPDLLLAPFDFPAMFTSTVVLKVTDRAREVMGLPPPLVEPQSIMRVMQ